MQSNVFKTQVCVIGGGSGGIGAAVGAALNGSDVVLVEKNHIPGGTVTMSWVHTWEPVCGTSPLCERLWNRMREIPLGASDIDYVLSTKRINSDTGERNPPLPFEPWAFLKAVEDEFAAAGNIKTLFNSTFLCASHDKRKIKSITCSGPGGNFEIEADWFIDSTDEIYLARNAGCASSLGSDPKSKYGEPHAPEIADRNSLNTVNWIYRVRPVDHPVTVDNSPVPKTAQINAFCAPKMPNGDHLINICGVGLMSPEEPEKVSAVLKEQYKLAWDSYRWQLISGNHPDWELVGFAPQIGVREGYRLDARYVINENDIIAGHERQTCKNVAALCDHRLDIHGSSFCHELEHPLAIPLESLMAKEYDNLLVASRGAGFSHIAAGSCRLSRTIMTLGEAAGRFAAGKY